jgi:hypothetical protein
MTRQTIMLRAWAIFRQTYHYPAVPFRSLGHPCFAWALRRAWAEAREAARAAAIPTEAKAARIDGLRRALELVPYIEDWRQAVAQRRQLEAEITSLAA